MYVELLAVRRAFGRVGGGGGGLRRGWPELGDGSLLTRIGMCTTRAVPPLVDVAEVDNGGLLIGERPVARCSKLGAERGRGGPVGGLCSPLVCACDGVCER